MFQGPSPRGPSGIGAQRLLALFAAGLYGALVTAPADYQQGETVRIMYIHVPSAWMAVFVYVVVAAASAVSAASVQVKVLEEPDALALALEQALGLGLGLHARGRLLGHEDAHAVAERVEAPRARATLARALRGARASASARATRRRSLACRVRARRSARACRARARARSRAATWRASGARCAARRVPAATA